MKTGVIPTLAVAVGSALAYDDCLLNSSWNGCVSTRTNSASSVCDPIATLPLTVATSYLLSCHCDEFDIVYSCAKTYCPDATLFQTQYLDGYRTCTSAFSNGVAAPSTTAETRSTAVPSTSSTSIPTSTTASSTIETPSTLAITSAPGVTTSVAIVQQPTTISSSSAAADPARVLNDGIGGVLAFVAGMAALM
ncbi:hypothetical protein GGR51DRAFT_437900 [Nemania sp. FL0031]|nr:hypothetical protein GGR51DRAFT_437900 [Nemania sp. FL0031]